MSWETVIEYCGKQRTGKTTLMVADTMLKGLLPTESGGFGYRPSEVYCNFWLDIDGVNRGNNEQMLSWLKRGRAENWQHRWFVVDEASQPPLPFYARGYARQEQTELVTALWQFPKKFNFILYSDNLGNSVDVQMRDATQLTVIPMRYNSYPEDRQLDNIEFRVLNPNEMWERDMIFHHPAEIQEWFDSFRPVD